MEIVSYDPSWPEEGAAASAALTGALPGLFLEVEHVGSTSVPGLAAKPVIDLMASATSLNVVTTDRPTALKHLGYRLQKAGMPPALFYFRSGQTDGALITCTSSPPRPGRRATSGCSVTTCDRILRWRRKYGELKQRAASERADGPAYTNRKTDLTQRVVDRERAARGLPLVAAWEE